MATGLGEEHLNIFSIVSDIHMIIDASIQQVNNLQYDTE